MAPAAQPVKSAEADGSSSSSGGTDLYEAGELLVGAVVAAALLLF